MEFLIATAYAYGIILAVSIGLLAAFLVIEPFLKRRAQKERMEMTLRYRKDRMKGIPHRRREDYEY